jgi:hypothetical protein
MKISKRQKTLYNHYIAVERELMNIYALALNFRSPHKDIIANCKKLYENEHYRRLTAYYRGVVSGMQKILYEKYYENLEYKMFWDGQYYSHWQDLPESAKIFLKESTDNNLSCYVYKLDNQKIF